MRGIGNIGVFCMGDELSQMQNGLFGNKIARAASDEVKRKREIRPQLGSALPIDVLGCLGRLVWLTLFYG